MGPQARTSCLALGATCAAAPFSPLLSNTSISSTGWLVKPRVFVVHFGRKMWKAMLLRLLLEIRRGYISLYPLLYAYWKAGKE